MKIAIITGPRSISAEDYVYVQAVTREIISRGFRVYVGDATGVDAIAWDLAQQESDRCQIGLYERFCPRPDLGRSPAGLAERSTRMVKTAIRDADEVLCIGFPNKPCPASIVPARSWRSGENEGSGTWSTLALAVGHKIETWIFSLRPKSVWEQWSDLAPGSWPAKYGSCVWKNFNSNYCAWHFTPAPNLFPDLGHDALANGWTELARENNAEEPQG